MTRRKHIYFLLLLMLGLTSCFQEDDPVPPYQSPAGVTTSVAEMGPLYGVQMFYDLGTDSFVKVVDRESWDIAFQSADNKYHIYLNEAKYMSAANTGLTDFSAVTSSTGLEFVHDVSSGREDSTAIGEWGNWDGNNVISYNDVYVLDLGVSTLGIELGKRKIQMVGLAGGQYTIRFANLDGSNEHQVTLTKRPDRNFVYLSLAGVGSEVDAEPDKYDWDLVFTQYTAKVLDQSSNIYEDYSVNGVLINPYMVRGARDFTKPFEDIIYNDLATYNFRTEWDIIGYDWKYYNFDLSTYFIEPGRTYILQDVAGDYYKLRFVSFTNELGVKGYPKFEIGRF